MSRSNICKWHRDVAHRPYVTNACTFNIWPPLYTIIMQIIWIHCIGWCRYISYSTVIEGGKLKNDTLTHFFLRWLNPSIRRYNGGKSMLEWHELKISVSWLGVIMIVLLCNRDCIRLTCIGCVLHHYKGACFLSSFPSTAVFQYLRHYSQVEIWLPALKCCGN